MSTPRVCWSHDRGLLLLGRDGGLSGGGCDEPCFGRCPAAIAAFKASDQLEDMFPGRNTSPSRMCIPRCEYYMDNSPGDDWDGAWTMTSK